MTITLPTGEKVATEERNGDHFQELLPVHNIDNPGGPISTSDRNPFPVKLPDTLLDAFSRLRMTSVTTLGDFKQVVQTHNPLIWSQKTAGGGNSIYVQDVAAQRLQVGTSSGDSVIRQTKRYYRYSPGKSAYIMFTALFRQGQNSTIKRAGYFDDNNGLFFQQTVNNMEVVVRSKSSGSVVDTVASQVASGPIIRWNIDTLDGSGNTNNPSGIRLDNTKSQIHIIDFGWLGLGPVRFGYIIGSDIHYVHAFEHSNNESRVFMQTPNLPMRFEVVNSTTAPASATFDQICFAILLEGEGGSDGIRRAADTGIAGKSFDDNLTPIITLRPNSANIRATIANIDLEILGGANYRWAALLNPAITDTTPPSWVTLPNSVAEYDITREGVVSGGSLLRSGYSPSKGDTAFNPLLSLEEDIGVYADIDGVPDELVIAAQKISGGSDTAHASLSWRELI